MPGTRRRERLLPPCNMHPVNPAMDGLQLEARGQRGKRPDSWGSMVHRGCCSEWNGTNWRNGFPVKGAVWSRQLDPGPLGFHFQLIRVSESSDFGDLLGA